MRALPADLFCKEVVREWIDSEGRGFLLSCGHTVHLPEVTRAKSGTTTSGVGCEQCIRAAGFPGSSPDRQSPHASDVTGERANRDADVFIHGRQSNRDWRRGICHKVTVCLRSMGYTNAHYGDTGGAIFCVFVPTDVKAARYEGREWIFGLAHDTWGGELLDEEGQALDGSGVDTGISAESEDVTAIATAIATAIHASDATADDAIDFKGLASAFMPELMRYSDTFTEWTLEFPGIVELHVEGGGVWIIGDTNGPIGADYYFSEKDFGEGEPSHYSVEIAASDDPAIIAERLSAAMSAV